MFDFVTIDFETANSNLNSACSVGIVAVKDLEIVDSFESYIQPPDNRFADNNIHIHGITPDLTEHAPTLDDLWCEISKYFSSHTPVIAHNAHFDMSVLRQSTSAHISNFPYVDSIRIASLFMTGSKTLDRCADFFGIKMDRHHNALSDASTAAEIVLHAIKEYDCATMWEFLAYADVAINQFAELSLQKYLDFGENRHYNRPNHYNHTPKPSEISPTCKVDSSHPLFDKSIVFTGELLVSRTEAMQIAVNCGAKVRGSVSKRTNYLVVGRQDPTVIGEDGLSNKQRTALALNADGVGHIIILTEDEFYALTKSEG